VILGAGLDSFAQRRPEIASRLKVFEIDQPGPQAWKRQRLNSLSERQFKALSKVQTSSNMRMRFHPFTRLSGFSLG
jgi:O-methyltransferase involved in polyketide biosynthesis